MDSIKTFAQHYNEAQATKKTKYLGLMEETIADLRAKITQTKVTIAKTNLMLATLENRDTSEARHLITLRNKLLEYMLNSELTIAEYNCQRRMNLEQLLTD